MNHRTSLCPSLTIVPLLLVGSRCKSIEQDAPIWESLPDVSVSETIFEENIFWTSNGIDTMFPRFRFQEWQPSLPHSVLVHLKNHSDICFVHVYVVWCIIWIIYGCFLTSDSQNGIEYKQVSV